MERKMYVLDFQEFLKCASRNKDLSDPNENRVIIVGNKYGITKKEDFLKWRNPKMNRYDKVIRMHDAGRWQEVPVPRKPISGPEIVKYLDSIDEVKVSFVFRGCAENGL